MGEKTIVAIAEALASGLAVKDINYISGSAYKCKNIDNLYDYISLPDFSEVVSNKEAYIDSTLLQYRNNDHKNGKTLVEKYPDDWYVVVNPPSTPLTETEMDEVYDLPYQRTFHSMYNYVPAIEEVQFSIISNRGCFGGCAFCALGLHQGRVISSRSVDSVVTEAQSLSEMPMFKGYIHDIGGPTANFLEKACIKQIEEGVCTNRECLTPKPCPNLSVSHKKLQLILQKVRELPKVKKAFIRSGIRFDYLLLDKDETFFEDLVQHHISGQLKVAPEHIDDKVLKYMKKADFATYQVFCDKYEKLNKKHNKQQYLVPYFISSHPGCGIEEAISLACYLKSINHIPKQVQDFYPTPGTIATCMYYSEMDVYTKKKIYVAKTYHSKIEQRALMQFSYPKNHDIVHRVLKKANRLDLVGFGKQCLIKPPRKINLKKSNS